MLKLRKGCSNERLTSTSPPSIRAPRRPGACSSTARAGWVEHNATEIWENTRIVAGAALHKADLNENDIAAVGITNQRETALVWDRNTGEPVYNAIVWQDTRTDPICQELGALGGGAERYKAKVGLPLATYFSGPKVRWILDNVEGARA